LTQLFTGKVQHMFTINVTYNLYYYYTSYQYRLVHNVLPSHNIFTWFPLICCQFCLY